MRIWVALYATTAATRTASLRTFTLVLTRDSLERLVPWLATRVSYIAVFITRIMTKLCVVIIAKMRMTSVRRNCSDITITMHIAGGATFVLPEGVAASTTFACIRIALLIQRTNRTIPETRNETIKIRCGFALLVEVLHRRL
jgi:hypothetical protein